MKVKTNVTHTVRIAEGVRVTWEEGRSSVLLFCDRKEVMIPGWMVPKIIEALGYTQNRHEVA